VISEAASGAAGIPLHSYQWNAHATRSSSRRYKILGGAHCWNNDLRDL